MFRIFTQSDRNSKSYINKFDSVNELNPLDLYDESKILFSV